MLQSTKQGLLITSKKLASRGTNSEIIVTATLFGVDIYVASDSYRPGKPVWLKYSPNALY